MISLTKIALFFLLVYVIVFLPLSAIPLPKEPINAIEIVYVDRQFSNLEKSFIKQAGEEWQIATNNMVKFIFIYDSAPINIVADNHTIIRRFYMRPAKENEFIVQYLDFILKADLLGWWDEHNLLNNNINTMIIVRSRISSQKEYVSVIMHENGHALKLEHSKYENALMYPSMMYRDLCITLDDLNQFCTIYHCNATKLNYCVRF
jgi:hypothetical protein